MYLKTRKPIVDFRRSWQSLLKRLGIKGARSHDLHHSFATYALMRKSGDLVSLQATLGHANISTIGRYAKALMEYQQRLVNSFEMPESESNIINLREAGRVITFAGAILLPLLKGGGGIIFPHP